MVTHAGPRLPTRSASGMEESKPKEGLYSLYDETVLFPKSIYDVC